MVVMGTTTKKKMCKMMTSLLSKNGVGKTETAKDPSQYMSSLMCCNKRK